MNIRVLLLCALLCPLRSALAADAPAFFTVMTAPGHSVDETADQLKTKFADQIKPLSYSSHGQSHTANAIPLLAVLKEAGLVVDLKMDPKADPKTKNLPLRETVIITGSDGYAAAIAVAELLPDIGNHDAFIAIDRDGQPLGDRGPVELIVPGDVKPGRWVRQVAKIQIVMPPTTQP